jgi:hypothetical protein
MDLIPLMLIPSTAIPCGLAKASRQGDLFPALSDCHPAGCLPA